MKKGSASVVFIQGFGRDDPFTDVPPESLWGWQRNVGILIALLNRKGITWQEKYARHLSEVTEGADLFVLRDWRYSHEEVYQFRKRTPGIPVISMLFQGPRYCIDSQQIGEEKALFGITQPEADERQNDSEQGLFLADYVVVRSQLNADTFAQLGYPKEKMVLLPHAPVWTLHQGRVSAAELPCPGSSPAGQYDQGFDLLFVGNNPLRKGLFRLYDAFSTLDIPGKRLHVYSRMVFKYARGSDVDLPDCMLMPIRQMMHDPSVTIHAPYRNLAGLVGAHANADLAVCPSLYDCGPNVLVEAYQLGTPALASTLCGAAADLPEGSVHLVTAPRWWHQKEGASAFTERLVEEITRLYLHNNRCLSSQPYRPDVSPLVETIVETWVSLLSRFF
jgi:glycosyltransferase involved in cell wall biosynthesis